MCHKMKEILKLIKEFVAIMNSEETRAAIEAYKELQELWQTDSEEAAASEKIRLMRGDLNEATAEMKDVLNEAEN